MRILIAEDDLTSRNMLAMVLRKAGHEVVETVNGAQAWEVFQKPESPKLAIIDWMMPEIDGLEVVRRVRAQETEHPPFILMLTSKTEKVEIIAGLDAGANDYLVKPFDVGELKARVGVGCRMVELQEALIKSREALLHEATHDPLTGLFNRRAVLELLHKELARAFRHGDLLSVGMVDIDHFKKVNDTYGHQTGDDVLCEVTSFLKKTLRSYDSLGRMGGEEFLIIAPMKQATDPTSLFNRICRSVAETKLNTRSGEIAVSISIGVAIATPSSTIDALLGDADAALYRAKSQGRNQIVVDYKNLPPHVIPEKSESGS